MRLSPEEIQEIAKHGSEESHKTVLGRLMECFFEEMMAKFWARKAKHPGQDSVTDENFDWKNYDLKQLEDHLIQEFFERFPRLHYLLPHLKPEDAKMINADKLTMDDPLTENIDISNLSFVDWACRIMRK